MAKDDSNNESSGRPNVANLRSQFDRIAPSSSSRSDQTRLPPPVPGKPNSAALESIFTRYKGVRARASSLSRSTPPSNPQHHTVHSLVSGGLSLTQPVIQVHSPQTPRNEQVPNPQISKPPLPPPRRSISPNISISQPSNVAFTSALPRTLLDPNHDQSGQTPVPPSPRRHWVSAQQAPPGHPMHQRAKSLIPPSVNRTSKPLLLTNRAGTPRFVRRVPSLEKTREEAAAAASPLRQTFTGPRELAQTIPNDDFGRDDGMRDMSHGQRWAAYMSSHGHNAAGKITGARKALPHQISAHTTGLPSRWAGASPHVSKHMTGPAGIQSVPAVTIRPSRPGPPLPERPSSHKIEAGYSKPLAPSRGVETTFPDISESNRRPPPVTSLEYSNKSHTLFALSGSTLCITGPSTCVWGLYSERPTIALVHEDYSGKISMTAVAFKPGAEPASPTHVWLGSEKGGVYELDISTGLFDHTNILAHLSAKVVAIHQILAEMWTIDINGKVNIWRTDRNGSPSLLVKPLAFNATRRHSFSLPIGGDLWYAVSNQLWVYRYDFAATKVVTVTERPLQADNGGEIIGGCVLSRDLDTVYFGHSDGWISVYDRRTFTFIGSVLVTQQKISYIAGVGDFLWIYLSTNQIQVYDTRPKPWKLVKDWLAHEKKKKAIGMVTDRSGAWKNGQLLVVTHDGDKTINGWNGLLEEDYIDWEMAGLAPEYCKYENLSILMTTWNTGATVPNDSSQYNFFPQFNSLPRSMVPPDIIVFGFQEVRDLESKSEAARTILKLKTEGPSNPERWKEHLIRKLKRTFPGSQYVLLESEDLVGLFSCVFVKLELRASISLPKTAQVKLGFHGLHGNKGALAIRFLVCDSSICLVNCHLAAGQEARIERNTHIHDIVDHVTFPKCGYPGSAKNFVCGGDGQKILDHEICIISGDMNYRIDDGDPRDPKGVRELNASSRIKLCIEKSELDKLMVKDQLISTRRTNVDFVLRCFRENPITFNPTYKYDVMTDKYSSSTKTPRSPAWCDRIVTRSSPHGLIKQHYYERYEVRESDHRPVGAFFTVTIKAVDENKFFKARDRAKKNYKSLTMRRIVRDASLDYLVSVLGLNYNEAVRSLDR